MSLDLKIDNVEYMGKDTTDDIVNHILSPLGQEVTVYSECQNGCCDCVSYIEGVRSQLKPCRFVNFVLGSDVEFKNSYLDMLWGITDGFQIS